MKMTRIAIVLGLLTGLLAAEERYFLPSDAVLAESVPSPAEFLGYEIGTRFTRHDRLVSYFRELGGKSPRARFEITGQTYEARPLLRLTVSSPENLDRLEEIRQAHLRAADPSQPADPSGPAVLYLGYGVHGNESSSAEAAMLAAYYLCAAQGGEIDRILEQAVILIDPVYNPDGRDRASHWFSMHRSQHLSADRYDREHNEGWPSGRTNHYWFDLNRDWLPAVHVESRTRIEAFHSWLPNVTTDYHEMGTDSTYFFEPTEPENHSPLVPPETYEMTAEFSRAWAEALREIGSLFYTRQRFDDFYPGYGSSYPDLHGGIGVLFEQASSRGHKSESDHGVIDFAFTIRNQVRTSLATVRKAVEMRPRLLDMQRRFFESALEAPADPAAYVFSEPYDHGRERAFLELLRLHRVEVRRLKNALSNDGGEFAAEDAWIVPLAQRQRRMAESIFETRTEFADNLFYDTSAWSMAHAYGIRHAPVAAEDFSEELLGEALQELPPVDTPAPARSDYAYLFEWADSRAASLLQELLAKDVIVKTAFAPFTARTEGGRREFPRGAMLIPVGIQKAGGQQLHEWLGAWGPRYGIPVYAASAGLTPEGVDLGSPDFRALDPPKVLMLIGEGVSAYEAGEAWHLLDTRVGMPFTKADISDFANVPLRRYNTLVLVSGNYSRLDDAAVERIRSWVEAGGTLIAVRGAAAWAIRQKIAEEGFVQAEEGEKPSESPRFDYAEAREVEGAKLIGGAIFKADLDTSHPLGFGFSRRELSVYRNSTIFLAPSENPYSTVARYGEDPLVSGYASAANQKLIASSASLMVSGRGSGRVVLFADNPNFRGFWRGTSRLFVNAIFFGSVIDVPRVRSSGRDAIEKH